VIDPKPNDHLFGLGTFRKGFPLHQTPRRRRCLSAGDRSAVARDDPQTIRKIAYLQDKPASDLADVSSCIVRNVIEYRRPSTGGMLCSHISRDSPAIVYSDRGSALSV